MFIDVHASSISFIRYVNGHFILIQACLRNVQHQISVYRSQLWINIVWNAPKHACFFDDYLVITPLFVNEYFMLFPYLMETNTWECCKTGREFLQFLCKWWYIAVSLVSRILELLRQYLYLIKPFLRGVVFYLFPSVRNIAVWCIFILCNDAFVFF